MRSVWATISLALVVVSVTSTLAFDYGQGGACQTPGPSCEAPPQAPRAPEQPSAPQPPAAPVYAAPPGMFQQPPASGTVFGPVEHSGVEGAAITFPAMTLRLPSIRWPAATRSRTNARMEIEAASAPYVQAAPLAPYAVPAAPLGYPPVSAPNPPPAAPTQPPSVPEQPPAAPQQGPRCDAPRAPACDQNALLERLHMLEASEQRLTAQLTVMQSIVDRQRAESVGRISDQPLPTATSRRTLPVLSEVREPLPVAPAEQQPIRLPLPGADNAQMDHAASIYAAKPVSYISEPAQFPRELRASGQPAAPIVRITGVRASH